MRELFEAAQKSKRGKRYPDPMDLLDAQIDLLSTMNVQYIESPMSTIWNRILPEATRISSFVQLLWI
jgi:hypothetical protein